MVKPRVKVQLEDFVVQAESGLLTSGRKDVGALVSFTGLCRDEAGTLSALELEHYPGMAEAELTQDGRKLGKLGSLLVADTINTALENAEDGSSDPGAADDIKRVFGDGGLPANMPTLIRALADEGLGVGVVSHDIHHFVVNATDRIEVMRLGANAASFRSGDVTGEQVVNAMVGGNESVNPAG